jgi:hypothetical protein
VHQNARTYDEVIFNRRANQKEGSWTKKLQERWPKKRQNEMKLRDLLPSLSQLIQVSHKEEEGAPTDKKRRDKEKVLKRRNDAKKKQKIEADKEKAREENEAKDKVEAEEKVVVEKEKELAEAARVAMELEEKVEKEATDKVVEEERQRKNTKNREGDTHPWTWIS